MGSRLFGRRAGILFLRGPALQKMVRSMITIQGCVHLVSNDVTVVLRRTEQKGIKAVPPSVVTLCGPMHQSNCTI